MKKGFVFLLLIGLLASTYYGLKTHFGVLEKSRHKKKKQRFNHVLESSIQYWKIR